MGWLPWTMNRHIHRGALDVINFRQPRGGKSFISHRVRVCVCSCAFCGRVTSRCLCACFWCVFFMWVCVFEVYMSKIRMGIIIFGVGSEVFSLYDAFRV